MVPRRPELTTFVLADNMQLRPIAEIDNKELINTKHVFLMFN